VQPQGDKRIAVVARVSAAGARLAFIERPLGEAVNPVDFEQVGRELFRGGSSVSGAVRASSPPSPGFGKKVGGGVLLGAGVAAAVGGVAMGVQAQGQASRARTVPQIDTARHDSFASSARTSALVADVLYGAALASAVVGAVLLASGVGESGPSAPEKEKAKDAPGGPDLDSILFVPIDGGAAVSLSAHF
jgi:hypothetical protein